MEYLVKGRVHHVNGIPSTGATVRAYDLGLNGQGTCLGECITGEEGQYEIRYPAQELWRQGRRSANLVVEVVQDGEPPVWSEAVYQAKPTEVIDLSIPEGPLSEFEQLDRATRPFLDGQPFAGLTDGQLGRLANLAAITPGQLAARKRAETRFAAGPLSLAVRYALERSGVLAEAFRLGANARKAIALALDRAAADGVIPKLDAPPAALADQVLQEVADTWARSPQEGPNLVALWGRSLASDRPTLRQLIADYLVFEGDPRNFVEQLGRDKSSKHAQQLQLDARLLDFAEDHLPLAQALQREVASTNNITTYEAEDFLRLLQTYMVAPPVHVETAEQYAKSLVVRRNDVLGTQVFVANVRAGVGNLGQRPALFRFLSHHDLDDLDRLDVTAVIEGADVDDEQRRELRADLEGIQRLYRLTHDYTTADYLAGAHLSTPEAILAVDRSGFVARHRGALDPGLAGMIYDRAGEMVAVTLSAIGQYSAAFQRPATRSTTSVPDDAVRAVPSAEELFGNLDVCACGPCASIFSPSAYLVDLIEYLRRATTGAALQELRARRPDITALELSCDNAESLLPAIDVVNEVLEESISRTAGRPVATVTATVGTKEERFAHPQRIIQAVYDTELYNARFPFGLPFDLSSEELRAYLQAMGSSRLEWMELASGSPDNAVRTPEVAHEHLGLNPVDASILQQVGWHRTEWGLILGQSPYFSVAPIHHLMRRTGLDFAELERVLACRFVSGTDQPVPITRDAPCRFDQMRAVLGDARLIRLHRFLRLQRAVGWDPYRLDRVLVAVGALRSPTFDTQPIDNVLLLRVSQVKRVAEMLRQDPVHVANWWTDRLDTHLYGVGPGSAAQARLVRQLRLARAVGSYARTSSIPVTTAFSLLADVTLDQFEAADAVLTRQAQGNAAIDWSVRVRPTGVVVVSVGAVATQVETQAAVVQPGAPLRLAVVFDGAAAPASRIQIYVDGQPVASQAVGGPPPAQVPATATEHRVSDPLEGFTGVLRSLTVFSRALGAADVLRLHGTAGASSLGEPGLGLVLDLNAGRATQPGMLPDLSGNGRDAVLVAVPANAIETVPAAVFPYPTLTELLGADELSPYYDVFLDRALASGPAPAFPLDPAVFHQQPLTVDDESGAVAASLGLLGADLAELVRFAFGVAPDQVALTEENLAILFRHDRLRRGLRVGLGEYAALVRLFGRNPFGSPLEAVEFVRFAHAVEDSEFSAPELLEILLAEPRADDAAAQQTAARYRVALELHEVATGSAAGPGQDRAVRDHLAQWLGVEVDLSGILLAELWQPGQEAQQTPIIQVFRALSAVAGPGRPTEQQLAPAADALVRLGHAARLFTGFGLSAPDVVQWIFGRAWADDLRALPTSPPPGAGNAFSVYSRLRRLAELSADFARAPVSFVTLLPPQGPPAEDQFWDQVADATGWPRGGLESIRGALRPADALRRGQPNERLAFPQHFTDADGLHAVACVVKRAVELGGIPGSAIHWGDPGHPPRETVDEAKHRARLRHGADDWWPAARELRDGLRQRQRDALVAYLLANPPAPVRQSGQAWSTPEHLFDYFLIDPLVTPAVDTSRIAHAISSVQRLAQRALANLEPRLSLDAGAAEEWTWRKNYRVWKANRRVFVYPENWLYPELRRDKSELFQRLESELRQTDVDQLAAAQALANYLSGLQELANLEVVTFHWEWSAAATRNQPSDGTLHVIGRTRAEPHRYFYRTRRGARYTSWQPVGLDLNSHAIQIVVAHGRVLLFWLILREEAQLGTTPQPPQLIVQASYGELRDGRWLGGRSTSESLTLPTWFVPAGWGPAQRIRLTANPGVDLTVVLTVHSVGDHQGLSGAGELNTLERWISFSLVDGSLTWRGGASWTRPTYYTGGVLHVNPRNQILESATSLRLLTLSEPYDPTVGVVPRYATLLQRAPESFRVTGELWQKMIAGHGTPFFLRTTNSAFLIQPQPKSPGLRSLSNDPRVGFGSFDDYTYRFEVFAHPQVPEMRRRYVGDGLQALYALDYQQTPGPTVDFAAYNPNPAFVPEIPGDVLQFDPNTPSGGYNWELYFHAPLLIAEHLKRNRRFEEAQDWLHFIFNPFVGGTDTSVSRFWRFKPLHDLGATTSIQDLLALLSYSGSSALAADRRRELERQVQAWTEDPFEPHRIAELRLTAYQKNVFMRYLDLLIDWGDDLFRHGARESTQEALQHYVLAAELLGPRPEEVPALPAANPPTYDQIEQNGFNALSNSVWNVTRPLLNGNASRIAEELRQALELISARSVFCVPANDQLLTYWDTVADRLFKIRGGLTLDGAPDESPLFAPPIDPLLLVRARAEGVRLDDVLGGLGLPRFRGYRFEALVRHALELTGELRALGQSVLSALEKLDAEALAQLRAEKMLHIATAGRSVREDAMRGAKAGLQSLRIAKRQAEARERYYRGLKFMNPEEQSELSLLESAQGLETGAGMYSIMASILGAIPDTTAGMPGGVTFGGSHLGNIYRALSEFFRILAAEERHSANRAGRMSVYQRRQEEWGLQIEQAGFDVARLARDIAAAEIQVALAEHELAVHDADIEHQRDVDGVMRTKFTNSELYDWMVGQLGAIHFQGYELALDLARSAEAAYQFETRDPAARFIDLTYWDGFRRGLLAADRLHHDLRRMEAAYVENTPRELRIVKHVSLAQVAPEALVTLRHRGDARFQLTEELFDADYPGHFMRQLRRVGVTIPVVAGPFSGVNATLTLEESWVRLDGTPAAGFAHDQTSEEIVTSTAQNDAMLEANELARGHRGPFEGRGAIGRWRIQIPSGTSRFPLASIPDVVLHLTYTARPGSPALQADATNRSAAAWPGVPSAGGAGRPSPAAGARGQRLLSARREFSDAWAGFVGGPGTGAQAVLTIALDAEHFDGSLRNRNVDLEAVRFIFLIREGAQYAAGQGHTVQVRLPGAPQAQAVPIQSVSSLPVVDVPLAAPVTLGTASLDLAIDRAVLAGLNIQDVLVVCAYTVA